jgi:hypothetical protein
MPRKPSNVSPVVINPEGVPFRARLVFKGDRYGLDRCLVYDERSPMIEFYDARYASVRSKYCTRPRKHHDPEGYEVSSYYLSTFLGTVQWIRGEPSTRTGLSLEGSETDYYLSPANVRKFTVWAKARVKAHKAKR